MAQEQKDKVYNFSDMVTFKWGKGTHNKHKKEGTEELMHKAVAEVAQELKKGTIVSKDK